MAMTREEMQRLASYGRDGDTMLAHINPEEAALLKSRGGSGTINPNTGLPEFKKFYKRVTPAAVVKAVSNPVAAVKSVAAPVVAPVEKAVGQVTSNLANLPGSVENTVKQVAANPIAQIAIAYYMPGLVAEFAPSLSALGISGSAAQTAVANAIASTAVQVAQGVPLDKALQSAVTNAAVSSGSTEIAKQVNTVMQNPAVTNAIVSAGSSAAKTALNGGSQSDIERNLVAGLVGSATASATGSNIAGSAVGGGIAGGVTGALQGAASAYSAQKLAEEKAAAEKAAAEKTSGTSADPGVKVAGGDDSTALNMASISAKPEMLGKSGETASPLTSRVDEGVTIYERTITGKTPDGKEYSYIVSYDPTAPAGKQVSYTTSGVIKDAQGNVIPGGGGSASASFTRPDFTASTTTDTYNPNIITTTGGTSAVSTGRTSGTTSTTTGGTTGTGTTTGGTNEGVTSGTTGGTTGGVTGGTTTGGTTTGNATTGVITTGGTNTGTGTGTGTGTSGAGTGASDGTGVGTGSGGTGTGTGGERTGTGGEKDLPPVEDKRGTPVAYDPRIFTYGGKSPSTLGTTLKTAAPFYPVAGTSGGLTSTRGAGELESKETGKPRQNVWNEESLRLKDALGI